MSRWRSISRATGKGQIRIAKVLVRELGTGQEVRPCAWSDDLNFDVWLKRDVVEARGKVCSELWIECTSKPLDAVLLVVTFIDEATGDVTGQVVKMERDRAELN